MRSVVIAVNVAVIFSLFPFPVSADQPAREIIVQVDKVAYIWVVGAWNFEMCRILTDSIDDIPQYDDISTLCGLETTRMLNDEVIDLYYLGEYHYKVDEIHPLPQIEIQSSIAGGAIVVQAVDPLPDHDVVQIDAMINGSPGVCDTLTGTHIPGGLRCEFPYYRRPVLFSAFAVSSYGDTSKNITLRIGNSLQNNSYFWDPKLYVSVIGDNAYAKYNPYMDIPSTWGVVPGDHPVPDWLKIVPAKSLQTTHSYYYLGGQILLDSPSAGQNCPHYGVSGEYATVCGVLAVLDQIHQYQNAYDDQITVASQRTGVPNRLIKRIIAVESQFYPNAFGIDGERGLYQFTRDGADTLFRWNGPLYLEICAEYWDYCESLGYDNLDPWQRDVLINHVLNDFNNIYYLGSAIKANANQIKRLLWEINRIENPGEILTYEQLWMMTVLNYHAGATFTSAVLVNIRDLGIDVTWENFATVAGDLQHSGMNYINHIVTEP